MQQRQPFDRRRMEQLVQEQIVRLDPAGRGLRFDRGAIRTLIQPSLPHLEEVEGALEQGKISHDFLAASVHTLLANACDIAADLGAEVIDAEIIEASMKRYCPYAFWC